jgi:hypothetical protein
VAQQQIRHWSLLSNHLQRSDAALDYPRINKQSLLKMPRPVLIVAGKKKGRLAAAQRKLP